jgi:hypothetical protein
VKKYLCILYDCTYTHTHSTREKIFYSYMENAYQSSQFILLFVYFTFFMNFKLNMIFLFKIKGGNFLLSNQNVTSNLCLGFFLVFSLFIHSLCYFKFFLTLIFFLLYCYCHVVTVTYEIYMIIITYLGI